MVDFFFGNWRLIKGFYPNVELLYLVPFKKLFSNAQSAQKGRNGLHSFVLYPFFASTLFLKKKNF